MKQKKNKKINFKAIENLHNLSKSEVLKEFKLLTIEELEKLPKKRVMAYYKKNIQNLPYIIGNLETDDGGERIITKENKKYCLNLERLEKIVEDYKKKVQSVLNN